MFSAVTKNGGTYFIILVRVVGRGTAAFLLYGSVRSNPVPRVKLRIVFFLNLYTTLYTPVSRIHVGLVLAKWWRRDNGILVNRWGASELLLARRV